MMSTPGSTNVVPGPISAVVEAAKEVETLRVHVKVQNHHNEEVEQAKQQDAFADTLQSPAQHQPGHGRRWWPSCDGQPQQRWRGEAMDVCSF